MSVEPGPVRDLGSERITYEASHLYEAEAPKQPYALFDDWLADARIARDRGVKGEPTAMVLSTLSQAPDGTWRPHSRSVLLKSFDSSGFVFFTNYESDKGTQLAAHPFAALHFYWPAFYRQVRIEGTVTRVSAQESDAYWQERPRGHQLGATASRQSRPVGSLEELEEQYDAAEAQFAGKDVPRPPYWGGFRIAPERIEFWQGQPSRMHDRLNYLRSGESWLLERLSP